MFYFYALFVAWVFMYIEKREESPQDRKVRMLQELKNEVVTNYNMTDDDFDRLVYKAALAMKEGIEFDWDFWNSCRYVFAAFTTIGKDTKFSSYVTNATRRNGIYFLLSIRRLISYSCHLFLRVEQRKASSHSQDFVLNACAHLANKVEARET